MTLLAQNINGGPLNPSHIVTLNPNPVLIVIAGPAGSGKSTLCDRLVAERPEFNRVVTTTTRLPRPGEIDGVHYHFFSPETFRHKISRGEFLEWAAVHATEGRDRLYGTLAKSILDPLSQHLSLVMNIDVQGVEKLRSLRSQHPILGRAMCTAFIQVDREVLVARMRQRSQDTEAEIAHRMRTAEVEALEAPKFDYVIHSKTRDEDFAELCRITTEWQDRVRCRYPLESSGDREIAI